jgi:P27 family predicted phage terminase small subunit
MRGRKPKPVEQRRREGGRDVSHRPEPEMLLIAGRPQPAQLDEPPDELPVDAKRFWRDTVAKLVDAGMVDLVDEVALSMLATQYARWCQAGRVVAEFGHFATSSVGQLKEHPALKIERDAHAMFLRTAEQFGLTPVARARLGLAEIHRRTLAAEMTTALGAPELRPIVVDSTVVE